MVVPHDGGAGAGGEARGDREHRRGMGVDDIDIVVAHEASQRPHGPEVDRTPPLQAHPLDRGIELGGQWA